MWAYIIPAFATILVTIIEVRAERDRKEQKKIQERIEARAKIRAEEGQLSMQMIDAAIELCMATALAVEEHKFNGELKKAKNKAETAQENYQNFIKKVAVNQFIKEG